MRVFALLVLCWPVLAHAAWEDLDIEFEQDKPWQEIEAQLPAYPKSEHLLPFEVSATAPHRYFIDSTSIQVGADLAIRYTVVVESRLGARTVSFEGLRCETAERRIYAFGRPEGTWSRARESRWEPIKLRSALSYHKPLYEAFFCPDDIRVKDGAEAVRNLKRAAR